MAGRVFLEKMKAGSLCKSAWCLCETSLGNLSLVTVLLSDGQKQTQGCQQGGAGHRKQSSHIYYHTYIHIYIFHVYTQIVFSLGSIKKIDQPSIYKKYLLYMIEKSLLQVYTDLHPRLSPKYTIRGNVLSLSVEGGPCRRWRDAGQHTCLHAHTHAYTSHTGHTQQ